MNTKKQDRAKRVATATAAMEAAIADDEVGMKFHNAVREVLAARKGKPITAHIKTAMQKKFPNVTFYWDKNLSSFYLFAWGGETRKDYNDRLMIHVGSTGYLTGTEPLCDPDKFHNSDDTCHGEAAAKRIATAREQIKNGTIEKMVDAAAALEAAREAYEEAFDSFTRPYAYSVADALGVKK